MKLFNITRNYVQKNPVLLLIACCSLLVTHVLFAHGGYFGNDDMVYAYYSASAGHSVAPACDNCTHFELRWIPVFVTAFFYEIFGLSDTSSALFSVLSIVSIAVIVYAMLRKEKLLVVGAAFALLFLNHSTVFYAHRLLADTGIAAFNFLAYYCYHRELFGTQNKSTLNATVFSVVLMLALMTKETIIILSPFWLLIFAMDLFKKRNYRFWLTAGLFLLIFAIGYLLYFKLENGDWFYRYHLLQTNNAISDETYAEHPAADLWKRVGYELWKVFLYNGDMEYLLFAIAGLLYFKSVFKEERIKHIARSFFVLLLCSNFMSFTFSTYSPLWPDPRHFLFLIPFAIISGAYILAAYMREPGKYIGLLFCFLVAGIFLLFSDLGGTRYVYFGITVLLLMRWILSVYSKRVSLLYLSFGLLVLFMSSNYFFDFLTERYPFYYDQKAIVGNQLKNTDDATIVYTGDMITARLGNYMRSFKEDGLHFANIDTCKTFNSNEGTKYFLLINAGYDASFAKSVDSLRLKNTAPAGMRLVEKVNSAALYEINDPTWLASFKHYSTSGF